MTRAPEYAARFARSVRPNRCGVPSGTTAAGTRRTSSRYGLTPESFTEILKARGYACGMCHEPFEEGVPVCVDHNHACCPGEKRSCGKCVRGLLCRSGNTALGHLERKYALARVPGQPSSSRRGGLAQRENPLHGG